MLSRLRTLLVIVLTLSAVYLYGFPEPNLPYAVAIVGHMLLGVVLAILLLPALVQAFRGQSPGARLGWLGLTVGAALGVVLIVTGGTLPYRPLVYAHIAASAAGVTLLAASWLGSRGVLSVGAGRVVARYAAVTLVVTGLGAGAYYTRVVRHDQAYRITNPAMPPEAMTAEGLGSAGPFFPSSTRTPEGHTIKSTFFMDSKACERCHGDVYHQWYGSAHHFSSFNNQWYRKSVEYMQDVVGVQPSKWCGGCHDPAILFSGLMNTPIRQIINRPESQAGLGCVACHAIVSVNSTMGQGGYTMEYPTLSDLAASEQPVMRFLHDFIVKLNPEPHRRAFLKPFMKKQAPDFCSACHKVHLDVPVNGYRWIRGFNDYDNWQASGVSGMGARSFYYPPQPLLCVDCHMPKVRSNDFGNKLGLIASHRFAGANTALPTANEDEEQLKATEAFLKDAVTVDVFALGPAIKRTGGSMLPGGDLATTFAVGEEGSMESRGVISGLGPVEPVTAPLNRADAAVRRGDTVRVDVVVRTRRVGHFFPGGTVDAFDVWVELQAVDDKGQIIFWSGAVDDGGKGPVDPGAHFYKSLQVDANGNVINKRNAWSTRAVVYVKLIPPGAADTVHYRLQIPESAGDRITLKAKLNYRKFMWYNTQFAYAGEPDPAGHDAGVTRDYDDRNFVFTADTTDVSGKVKHIPNLPIVVMSEDEATLRVLPRGAPEPPWKTVLRPEDWTRWNDYGIGFLLQGDLKHAEAAFEKITEIDPKNPDGWVNIGRVRVQEGNLVGAREVLEKALALAPDLARANYFMSRVEKSEGKLQQAVNRLERVSAQYPKDRVVHNDLGRTLFLMRRYKEAVAEFEQTLSIDPEDLTAHYNLMLCYNGLNEEARSKEHEERYLRFKADEASQSITGPYRLKNPDDNNERQSIHEHASVDLAEVGPDGVWHEKARQAPPAPRPPATRQARVKAAPSRQKSRAAIPAMATGGR
jgi:tetratricopeptide (TPR) repeat protein